MSDNVIVAVFVFVAALLQVTLVASVDIAGGTADVLLLSLISIVFGSMIGSMAGNLIKRRRRHFRRHQ